jgi:hypothetical protein
MLLGNLSAQAALIDFTIPSGVLATYQPLAPADVITYNNVAIYNGAPDHTSGMAGTDNYFIYPASGNAGTATLSFSAPVTVNSFWYGLFHNTGTDVIASIYSNATATGTPLDTLTLTTVAGPDGIGPIWNFSGTGFSAFHDVESVTFTNASGGADAVNIDDITVTPVPEPSAMVALLGLGAVGLFVVARRRKHKAG